MSSSSSVVPLCHFGPVTALSFIPSTPYLVAGYGSSAKVFNYVSGEHLSTAKIFARNKIHGILISNSNDFNSISNNESQQQPQQRSLDDIKILFFGGRSVSVVGLTQLLRFAPSLTDDFYQALAQEQLLAQEKAANDWVIAGDFRYNSKNNSNNSKKNSKSFIYLLTAHDSVIGAEVLPTTPSGEHDILGYSFQVKWVKNCNEKSILYSGSFKVLQDKVLVFAGTVMSGIYVWQFIDEGNNSNDSGTILHHLTGHEGSIFGVRSNSSGSLAVSCSDDRSIKVWDLQTGQSIATGWGHGARIWHLEFFSDCGNDSVSKNDSPVAKLLSCSEDLTARLWDLEYENCNENNANDEKSQYLLNCKRVIESHSGKNVWSGAVNADATVAATGGNDGKIRLVQLDSISNDDDKSTASIDSTNEITLDLLSKFLPKGAQFAKNEIIKDVITTTETNDVILVVTSYANVFKLSSNFTNVEYINIHNTESSSNNNNDENVKKFVNNFFTVTHTANINANGDSIAIFTNNTGHQIFLTLDKFLIVKQVKRDNVNTSLNITFQGKITNAFAFAARSQKDVNNDILDTTDKLSSFLLFESPHPLDPFVLAEFDFSVARYTGVVKLLGKPNTQFVTTTFDFHYGLQWLILGSRYATFTIYELLAGGSSHDGEESNKAIEPTSTWKKILPGDTISEISIIKQLNKDSLLVSLLLRDGIYLYMRLSKTETESENTKKIKLLQMIKEAKNSKEVGLQSPVEKLVQGFNALEITNKQTIFKIEILQKNRISKGGFLEGLIEVDANFSITGRITGKSHHVNSKDVILYGFKSDYFYIFNETKGYEIWAEFCGGSHRLWRFVFDKHSSNPLSSFRFFYVRASSLVIKHKNESSKGFKKDILVEGSHGREIRDIAISDKEHFLYDSDGKKKLSYKLLVTGAEDTTLKFSKLFKAGNVKTYWTQRLHVSGLQSIKFLNDEFVISTAAREELYVWKINDIEQSSSLKAGNISDSRLYVENYASLPPSALSNPDLRIMDFDFVPAYGINHALMGYLVHTVYSNSQIKIFFFDIATKQFTLLVSDHYKDICIFASKFILTCSKTYLAIATSDGYLTIYDVKLPKMNDFRFNMFTSSVVGENLKLILFNSPSDRDGPNNQNESIEIKTLGRPIITQQLHQNGIKTICQIVLPQNFDETQIIHIVTGGDDNALGLFEIRASIETGEIEQGKTVAFIPGAASSTITSISQDPSDASLILVTSVDQIVRLWQIEVAREKGKTTQLTNAGESYTTIADTGSSSMTMFNNNSILAVIGGVGLTVFEV